MGFSLIEGGLKLASVDHIANPLRRMVYPVGGKSVGHRILELDSAGHIASRECRIP